MPFPHMIKSTHPMFNEKHGVCGFDAEFEIMHLHYETDPRLHVSDILFSYANGNMVQVNVD